MHANKCRDRQSRQMTKGSRSFTASSARQATRVSDCGAKSRLRAKGEGQRTFLTPCQGGNAPPRLIHSDMPLFARGWPDSTSICFRKTPPARIHTSSKCKLFPFTFLSRSFFVLLLLEGVWRLPASDTCGRKVTRRLIFHGRAQRCA